VARGKRDLRDLAKDDHVCVLDFLSKEVVFHSITHWVEINHPISELGDRPDDVPADRHGRSTGCGKWIREASDLAQPQTRGSTLPLWRAKKIARPCGRCWS
jgi:hypothetical protein